MILEYSSCTLLSYLDTQLFRYYNLITEGARGPRSYTSEEQFSITGSDGGKEGEGNEGKQKETKENSGKQRNKK